MGSEMGDFWREVKKEIKQKQRDRAAIATTRIKDWCLSRNITMQIINDWQIRISGNGITVDIFPQTNKWHCITRNERGQYKNIIQFLNVEFKQNL